eukprot:1294579-Alexandrium_andersonii.AAC.1
MADKKQLWPVDEAPMRVALALGAERQETLNTAMAGAVASYYDARNEQYPLEGCFPPTLELPEDRRLARPGSEEVLALAEAECWKRGVDPDQPMHTG